MARVGRDAVVPTVGDDRLAKPHVNVDNDGTSLILGMIDHGFW